MAKSKITKDFDFKSKLRAMSNGGEVSNPRAPYAQGGLISPVKEGYADGGLLSTYAENKAIPEVQQAMGLRRTLQAREQVLADPEANATRLPVRQIPSINPVLTNADYAVMRKGPTGGELPSFSGAFKDRYGMGPSGYADGGAVSGQMTDIFTKRTKMLDDPAAPLPVAAPASPAPAALPSVPTLTNQELTSLGKGPTGTAPPTFMGAVKDRFGMGPSGYRGGGKVAGPGGPTDDKVPAMLSDGEYVLPAKTVKHVGVDKLDKLVMKTNHKAPVHLQKKQGLRKFEAGGMFNDKRHLFGDISRDVNGPGGPWVAKLGKAVYEHATLPSFADPSPVQVPPDMAPLKPTVIDAKPLPGQQGTGKTMTTNIADTSGGFEKAIDDSYKVAADRAQAPAAPGLTPQNLRRFNSFQQVQNPLAGVQGSSFLGSLFMGAINRGTELAKASNNRTELANAEAQSRAIAAENAAKNTRYGTQMQGYGTDVQQRGQDITSGLRSKELGIQDRYQTGQLENQRAQRAFQQFQYQREQQEKAQTDLDARATQQASTLGPDGKVVTDPVLARRYKDFTQSSFPAATSGVADPNLRSQARTNSGANFELAQQGTQDNVNWLGKAAQAFGTLARREDYPQAVQMPMSGAPAGPATIAERFMNKHIPFFGSNVVRNEQGVPFQVGANTDLDRAKQRAVVGYEAGGYVKKRGLRRG